MCVCVWGGSAQQSDRCGGWTAAERRPIIPKQSLRLNTSEVGQGNEMLKKNKKDPTKSSRQQAEVRDCDGAP